MKKRKKMGRPPLPAERRKSRMVGVKLTPSDYAALTREAKAANLPRALFLVKCWKERGC